VSPDPANAYVWDEAYLGPLRDSLATSALVHWLASRALKCGQNVPYDIRSSMRGLGVTPRGVAFDLRLARKMVQADADGDLETMALLWGVSSPKSEVDRYEAPIRRAVAKVMKTGDFSIKAGSMSRADLETTVRRLKQRPVLKKYVNAFIKASHTPELRARYCASDAMVTTMGRLMIEPVLRADPALSKVHDDVVVPLIHAISMIEDEGLPIDRDAVSLLDSAMSEEVQQALAEVAVHGDVNLNSAKDVGDFLFKRLKIPRPNIKLGKKKPKTGQPSTAGEVLKKISHPAAAAILKYRTAAKFKATYAEGMLQYVRDDDRVHTSYLLDGAESGRPSARDPAVLTIPRANKPRGKMCRDIFVTEPGWTIVELDQNQGEIRGAAMVSGDKVMLETLMASHDFHLASGKLIAPLLGVDPALVDGKHHLRSAAKNGNFAVIYGKSDENLAVQLGITKKEAEKVRETILGKFPDLRAYIAAQLKRATVDGFVRVPWAGGVGRLRPLWRIADIDGEEKGTAERSSYNTPIQGLCAEFTNASVGAMQRWIEEECFPAKLVLTVYDSIIALVRDGCVDEYVRNAQRICTQWHSYGVPLKWDAKVGKAWGSLVDYKEPA
jgi:DNA polymerase-1